MCQFSKITEKPGEGNSFVEILEYMMERLSTDKVEQFGMIAKNIWKRRNDVLHGGSFTHPNAIVRNASELEYLYRHANAPRPNEGTLIQRESIWKKPPRGCYKVNWDVAIEAQKKQMGVGVIILDEQGRVAAA